ncbi:MAG: hypothetical protein AAF532_03015 [Planctomycetota bacterium]
MEGSVPAQTQWLKQRLVDRDGEDRDDPDLARLEALSDEELAAMARAYGVTLPEPEERPQ